MATRGSADAPGSHLAVELTTSFIEPDDPRWADSLARAPHDVYDTAEFVRLEARRIGAKPVVFLVRGGDCVFGVPLILRPVPSADDGRLDAVSPYGYPGIVLSPAARSNPVFVSDCVNGLVGALRARGVCSAFIRLHPLLNADLADLVRDHALTDNGSTVSIDLRLSEADIWAGMSKGHTNATNKARRAGFEMEVGRGDEHFEAFALVYRETMQRLAAAPMYDFGTEQLERLASLPEARVAVAKLNGHVAGAYLFYECGQLIQMHLGGTRTSYMSPSPSHLLIHGVALWAKQRDNCTLHLGGGVGGSATDSLFRFKCGFSAVRHRYLTMRLVCDEAIYCELVTERARQLDCSPETLREAGYFPAYRGSVPDDG
jgi:hypothetical protein